MRTSNGRPCRSERALSQRAGDTVVLLDPDSGEYYALEDIGALVWELCDGSRDIAEIAAVVCESYDAPTETVEPDVRELLAELGAARLIDYGA